MAEGRAFLGPDSAACTFPAPCSAENRPRAFRKLRAAARGFQPSQPSVPLRALRGGSRCPRNCVRASST